MIDRITGSTDPDVFNELPDRRVALKHPRSLVKQPCRRRNGVKSISLFRRPHPAFSHRPPERLPVLLPPKNARSSSRGTPNFQCAAADHVPAEPAVGILRVERAVVSAGFGILEIPGEDRNAVERAAGRHYAAAAQDSPARLDSTSSLNAAGTRPDPPYRFPEKNCTIVRQRRGRSAARSAGNISRRQTVRCRPVRRTHADQTVAN